MLEERIIALEEKYAHQDHLVDQLNKIVAKQELIIDGLILEIRNLRQAIGNMGQGGGGTNLEDEVPPHY
ncbi:SlyX family protein [Bacteriovorax sp. DB6_IX]|uniref:SlyX family protein n=1 Tax=Bacteriovorax sp. DB6_IX TaxID=1353530 RepID=UPI00038A1BEC|nr:SlyX family protein [Bacteriovorax sp. DB6_IX]EQC52068.1 SlyX family protein [Bacteriovorax sp. DB6_IX]